MKEKGRERCRMDSCIERPVAVSCKHGNEPSSVIKEREIL
jgi:hypothetical protein